MMRLAELYWRVALNQISKSSSTWWYPCVCTMEVAAENQLINVREAFSGLFFHHQHLPFSRAINQIQNLAFKTSHLQCDPAKKSREYTKYYKVEWVILNQVIAILTKNSRRHVKKIFVVYNFFCHLFSVLAVNIQNSCSNENFLTCLVFTYWIFFFRILFFSFF